MDMMEVADPDAVHAVRSFIRKQLAGELKVELLSTVCLLPRSCINIIY
jgi:aminopeptidase N